MGALNMCLHLQCRYVRGCTWQESFAPEHVQVCMLYRCFWFFAVSVEKCAYTCASMPVQQCTFNNFCAMKTIANFSRLSELRCDYKQTNLVEPWWCFSWTKRPTQSMLLNTQPVTDCAALTRHLYSTFCVRHRVPSSGSRNHQHPRKPMTQSQLHFCTGIIQSSEMVHASSN